MMILWAETEREAGLEDQVSKTGFQVHLHGSWEWGKWDTMALQV